MARWGILHDDDPRLADAMLSAASAAGLDDGVRRNYPYGPQDGVTHTLKKHGLTRQIANVMLEIRNDLISDADGQAEWAERIAGLLKAALAELNAQKGQSACVIWQSQGASCFLSRVRRRCPGGGRNEVC
jgi:predicted N-formylglutamate amidohydrolase